MAPIANKLIPMRDDWAWTMAASVLGAGLVMIMTASVVVLCACGGKKKREEAAPTDMGVDDRVEQAPPHVQARSELDVPPPPPEPMEPTSAKTAVEGNTQKPTSMSMVAEAKGAPEFQLMSKVDKENMSYRAAASGKTAVSNQPSLQLIDVKSRSTAPKLVEAKKKPLRNPDKKEGHIVLVN